MTQPDDMLSAMFGQRQPMPPDQLAAIKAYQAAVSANEIREREIAVANSWLFCTCRNAFTRVDVQTPPNHATCLIHGAFMVTRDGRVL